MSENLEQEVAVKKRRSKGKVPQSRAGLITSEEDRLFVKKLLQEVNEAYQKQPVTSDRELIERWNEYFETCAQRGQIPTVEEMCLWSGYSIQHVCNWENGREKGFSPLTMNIVKKAKGYLASFDAKLVISGKMNFLAYCFRAKNYYGLQDKVEHVLTPINDSLALDAGEIEKRYAYLEAETFDS